MSFPVCFPDVHFNKVCPHLLWWFRDSKLSNRQDVTGNEARVQTCVGLNCSDKNLCFSLTLIVFAWKKYMTFISKTVKYLNNYIHILYIINFIS